MSKKLIKTLILSLLLGTTSTLVGCNLKFLARSYVEEQNEEKLKQDAEFMEMQKQVTENLMDSGLEGKWQSDDESLTIIFEDKLHYKMYLENDSCEENYHEGNYICLDKILTLLKPISKDKDDMVNAHTHRFTIEKISEDEMRIISEEDNIDTIVKRNQ